MRIACLLLGLLATSACATGGELPKPSTAILKPPEVDDAALLEKARRAYVNYMGSRESDVKRQAYFDAVGKLTESRDAKWFRFHVEATRLDRTFRSDTPPYDATVKLLAGIHAETSRVGTGAKRVANLTAAAGHCYILFTSNYSYLGFTVTRGNAASIQVFKSLSSHGFCASTDAAVTMGIPGDNQGDPFVVIDVPRDRFPPMIAFYAEPDTHRALSECADDDFLSFFTHPIPGTVVYDDDGPVLLTQSRLSRNLHGYHLATGQIARVAHPSRTANGVTPIPKVAPWLSCWTISRPTNPTTHAIAACTNGVEDAGYAARLRALRSGKTANYAHRQRFNAEVAINGSCRTMIERQEKAFLKKFQDLSKNYDATPMSETLWQALGDATPQTRQPTPRATNNTE